MHTSFPAWYRTQAAITNRCSTLKCWLRCCIIIPYRENKCQSSFFSTVEDDDAIRRTLYSKGQFLRSSSIAFSAIFDMSMSVIGVFSTLPKSPLEHSLCSWQSMVPRNLSSIACLTSVDSVHTRTSSSIFLHLRTFSSKRSLSF